MKKKEKKCVNNDIYKIKKKLFYVFFFSFMNNNLN